MASDLRSDDGEDSLVSKTDYMAARLAAEIEGITPFSDPKRYVELIEKACVTRLFRELEESGDLLSWDGIDDDGQARRIYWGANPDTPREAFVKAISDRRRRNLPDQAALIEGRAREFFGDDWRN